MEGGGLQARTASPHARDQAPKGPLQGPVCGVYLDTSALKLSPKQRSSGHVTSTATEQKSDGLARHESCSLTAPDMTCSSPAAGHEGHSPGGGGSGNA